MSVTRAVEKERFGAHVKVEPANLPVDPGGRREESGCSLTLKDAEEQAWQAS